MSDKKANSRDCVLEFKLGHKAVETTLNINNIFGPRTAKEQTGSGGSRSSAKKARAVRMKSLVASYWKLAKRAPSKLTLYICKRRCPRNQCWSFYSRGIWSKLERWKSSVNGCLMSWSQIKKSSLWGVIFSYSMQQQRTISRSGCDVRWKVDFIQ